MTPNWCTVVGSRVIKNIAAKRKVLSLATHSDPILPVTSTSCSYKRSSSDVGDNVVEPAASIESHYPEPAIHGMLWVHDVMSVPESHRLPFALLRHTCMDVPAMRHEQIIFLLDASS